MNIIVGKGAYDDLDRIYAWIAKDHNIAADAVIQRILTSTRHLGRFPHIGHAGKADDTYEWIIPGLPYIVVYKIQATYNVLIVIAVFHCAQDR